MKSSAISTQIRIQENRIEECKVAIRTKKNTLDKQDSSYLVFVQKKGRYEESFEKALSNKNLATPFIDRLKMAKAYNDKMSSLLGDKLNNNAEKLNNISSELKKEIRKTEDELDELNRRLQRMQNELSSLYTDRSIALQREREEQKRIAKGK